MADEADDLDYSESNVGLAQAQGVRKNISLKLKGKGRGRGRRGGKVRRGSTKKVVGNDEETEEHVEEPEEPPSEKNSIDSNLDDVISKLETPAFSPMDRTFPEPLHQNKKLRWDHKVNLIGEKVIDPLIHCCEKCTLPILNYGRMIPCKHVFCFDCAKKSDKLCPKCEEKVQRIEPSALGTVFMCTFGGSRLSPGSCGRTYLSQRDLQAHVNHRHLKPSSTPVSAPAPATSHSVTVATAPVPAPAHLTVTRDPRDPRSHLQVDVSHQGLVVGHLQHPPDMREAVDHSRNVAISLGSPAGQSRQYPHSPASYPSTIPVSSARPNLITVPIQDDGAAHPTGTTTHIHSQPHVSAYAPSTVAPPHPMPAIQHPGTAYPPHPPYPHPTPVSAYSQAPPITTPTFSQPPPPVHHPPLHQPGTNTGAPIYSTPPPPVHHQPPATYTPPRAPAPRPMHPPPPQHHHEGAPPPSYLPQWGAPGTSVPPPPTRPALPPRPITAPPPSAPNPNVGMLQPHGPPADPGFRQPYYQ